MTKDQWDALYRIGMFLITSGILYGVFKVIVLIGEWVKWQKTIDKEVSAHGKMLHEQTGLVQRILGFLHGKFGKGTDDDTV